MKLLEHQAMGLFGHYGIPMMNSVVLERADMLDSQLAEAGLSFPVVIKAQVPVGGRGKAGGIRFADSLNQARSHCESLLGSQLLGHEVRAVLVTEKAQVKAEWYLSILLDRLDKCPVIMFSAQGGMDIEALARTSPEKILRLAIDPAIGIMPYMAAYLLSTSGLPSALLEGLDGLLQRLYRLFREQDALLVEINPLALCGDSDVITALDGKVEIDDSALYRQPEWLKAREAAQEEDFVKESRAYNFLYIPVQKQGTVAVMSNGSGMLMSCIDMIARQGIPVGAVLDLGGGATADRIYQGTRIMLSTPGIKAVLVNIFGGITRCDEVARGVRAAADAHLGPSQFVIVRMEGTNKQEGLDLLKEAGGSLLLAEDLKQSVDLLAQRRESL